MKNTVIYTVEITKVTDYNEFVPNEDFITKKVKETTYADDVVVTKVQVFEGPDSAKE